MAVLGVVIDRVTVYYGLTISLSDGDKEFRVRDDGWKMLIYRTDPDGGEILVDYVSFGTDSDRKPDQESAARELTVWAQAHFGDA